MKAEKLLVEPDPSKDQHLMTNLKTVERMVEAAGIKRNDTVLEIGAGSGILTERLARKRAKIIAVEIDRRFSKTLGKLDYGNVEIIYANVLEVIDEIEFNKIVSNIPYSICEPLINKLLKRKFDLALLSFPENFYNIISSGPGAKNYSLLSLKVDSFFSISLEFKIPAEDFSPHPKTDSCAIIIKPLSQKDYAKNPVKFLLRETLLQRKKKLKNSLMEALINMNKKILGKNFTKNMARNIIKKMDIEPQLLGKIVEEMKLKDFEILEERLKTFS
jgi:16S rRNA (adenine1518-N6/adenine1519-N6)-dimethyltransferase